MSEINYLILKTAVKSVIIQLLLCVRVVVLTAGI